MSKITSTPIITFVLIGLLVAFADAAKIEDLAPANSLVYVTISDFDEIWDEGAVSESWQSIFNSNGADGSLPEMNQVMEMMQFTIGTDLRGIIETFGRQIAFVIMPPPQSGKNDLSMALILDTGGSRKEAEDIISKISTVMTMDDEKVSANANMGQYKKIPYGKITMEERTFRYGFIDDLLVIGLKEGGFKTIVDTYRGKKNASISRNAKFKDIRKKFANVQVFGYANIDNALPFFKANDKSKIEQALQSKSPNLGSELPNIQSIDVIGFGVDVFSVDGLQKLYIQMKKDAQNIQTENAVTPGLINSMFHGGKELDSLLSLRNQEALQNSDLFFAMSFDNLSDLWQSLGSENDRQEKIQKLEDTSGLDFETEILGSLTGEIAVLANISDEIPEEKDKSIRWEELVIFMGLKERAKWESTIEAIQKLENVPTQKEYKYKGATIRELSLPENELFDTFSYGLTDETFIAATSTNKIRNIIDGAKNMKKSKEADNLLEQLPAPPSLLLDFNLDKLLPYIFASAGVEPDLTNTPNSQLNRNLGTCEYTVSPTSNGLWMCSRIIAGKNLVEIFGEIASVFVP